jgi:hypothetical protein
MDSAASNIADESVVFSILSSSTQYNLSSDTQWQSGKFRRSYT